MFSSLVFAATSVNPNIIKIKNKQYDLSQLKDTKQYLEDTGKAADLFKTTSLSQIKEDALMILDKSGKKRINNPEYNKHLQILIDNGYFKALSIDTSDIKTGIKSNKVESNAMLTAITQFNLEYNLRTNAQSIIDIYYSNYYLYCQYFPQDRAASMAYETAALNFAINVQGGGVWDYKKDIGWNTYVSVYINNSWYWMPGEDVGNIHYGFVGRTLFSSTTLLAAAGVVQILSGTAQLSWFGSYFDDPNDQVSINRGINYFNTGSFQ